LRVRNAEIEDVYNERYEDFIVKKIEEMPMLMKMTMKW